MGAPTVGCDAGKGSPRSSGGLETGVGCVDVFVQGKAGEVCSILEHPLAGRGVSKETSSISPYWRREYTDEAWRQARRQWLAEQAADV